MTAYFYEGLFDLGRVGDRAARRALWRQSILSLSQATTRQGPAPLDGVDPAALVGGVRAALAEGLLDDLEWLAPPTAAVALYEIASALPQGVEKREVGRRVAAHTYDGTADTFAAVATRMAIGSGKGLSGPPLRARVALSMELAPGKSPHADALALALASRRELVKEWIARPSRGSLPARRLAGRLVGRAAAEAVRLAAQGEEDAARVFRGETLAKPYQELLWDREPLVWKHAAIARGLLVGIMPELADELETQLDPALSPTEWRRAATSLGASVAAEPASATRRIHDWLGGGILERDRDVASCLLWGLAHAAPIAPEASEEILLAIVAHEGWSVAEAFEESARDRPPWRGTRANLLLRRDLMLHLALLGHRSGAGTAALAREVLHDLAPGSGVSPIASPATSVRFAVSQALTAFASQGAKRAHELALLALAVAREQVGTFHAWRRRSFRKATHESFALLRDLDVALLESATLSHLLALDRKWVEPSAAHPAVDELHDRLCEALLQEQEAAGSGSLSPVSTRGATIPLRRIKALIHVLDAEVEPASEVSARSSGVCGRWLRAAHALAHRLASFSAAGLPRSLGAALARALEGLVRAEVCDPVDVMLFTAGRLTDPEPFAILAEASKQPELVALFRKYAAFLRQDRVDINQADELRRRLEALGRLARDLSCEDSGREESLRAVLLRLSRALEAILGAGSLSDIAVAGSGGESVLGALAEAAGSLGQLVAAAAHRLADPDEHEARPAPRNSPSGLMRAAHAVSSDSGDRGEALADLLLRLGASLPRPIASVVAAALERARRLPRTSLRAEPLRANESLLPSWIPPRRSLGGFYVVRPLGTGGSGSVFVVKRAEERDDPRAETFALKVPAYSPQIARHMSEAAFLQSFQSEASALLSLPLHHNLARFVTFDLGARPKPILVMELVDGVSLDLVITRRQLSMARALNLLDGVLAGLEAMHAAGLAHLDVKPSNVVLRKGREPVLVDFGLAGRHVRPGCGSGPYGAPEVWGIADGGPSSATLADVYAAACLTYEMLTTQPLFDQPTEVALITAHVAHDGWPTPLRSWHRQREIAEVAELASRGLRRRPFDRIDIASFRKKLSSLAPSLTGLGWPLSP